jgi:iron complex transport system ATP-binding protein
MTLLASLPDIRRGGVTILHALRITAAPGEMLGVIGPNGAGKSTLLGSLAGIGAERAQVDWQGNPLPLSGIGYLPQAFRIEAGLSVLECVLLGRREVLGWRIGRAEIAAAETVLAEVGLAHLAQRAIDTLSGGQQQMVLLAQRLLRAPALMVLDEPTSALDLHHQLAILRRTQAFARDRGAVVVMALHDLTLAARFCDRLILLKRGRVVGTGAPGAVLSADSIADCWQITPEILWTRDAAPVIVPH